MLAEKADGRFFKPPAGFWIFEQLRGDCGSALRATLEEALERCDLHLFIVAAGDIARSLATRKVRRDFNSHRACVILPFRVRIVTDQPLERPVGLLVLFLILKSKCEPVERRIGILTLRIFLNVLAELADSLVPGLFANQAPA